MNKLMIILEIFLALLSFVFYKVMKFIIGNFYTIYLAVNRKNASRWRVLSAENLQSPLSLPVLMTKGPRWNTHAIIGTLGPFLVKDSLEIDLESANRSAKSWIAVVYRFPSYETIASFESEKVNSLDKWAFLSLKPGKYSLGLRYYNWSNQVNLPGVKVDGKEFVQPEFVPENVNDFYRDLIKQKNGFYLALHYYIFTILKLRKWLPESFVKSEYLPVGAPDTEFFYNFLSSNQALQIEVNSEIVKNYDIYLTIYDHCSLPLDWCQIQQEKFTTEPIGNNGYYLLRIRPKLEHKLTDSAIKFQGKNENSAIQSLKIFS